MLPLFPSLKYPGYHEIIVQLKKCHCDPPTTCLGICTDWKVQLDQCFRAGVHVGASSPCLLCLGFPPKEEKQELNFEATGPFKEKLRKSISAKLSCDLGNQWLDFANRIFLGRVEGIGIFNKHESMKRTRNH